ncbi:hypothetical protein Ancab_016974 [Ancistrocladus abbreviatus]
MQAYTSQFENPIVQSTRDKEPSHFIFEIESFSSLQKSIATTGTDRIESSEFSAGGQRWALVIYPNGNKKQEVSNGCISLYLKMLDKPIGGQSVYTSFKFFIFDKIRETYTIIQDVRERKFDAGHLEWGVVQALSIADFNDRNKGWLVNDSCTFGAEVYVIGGTAATSRLSLTTTRSSYPFRWQVHDFSSRTTDVDSSTFDIEGQPWKLHLHIGIDDKAGEVRSPSLYLCLDNGTNLIGGRKVLVHCEIVIKDELFGNKDTKSVVYWFDSDNNCYNIGNILEDGTLENQPQHEGQTQTQTQDRTVTFEATIKKVFSCSDIFED